VDRRALLLERENRRRGGVLEVDPGGDAPAVADDRILPLAHRLDETVIGVELDILADPERLRQLDFSILRR
jgi:hypothetical protein